MLIIRKEQMETLSKYMLNHFENRMIAHLRSRFKAQLVQTDDSELLALIRRGIEQAKQYDILEEFGIKRYLEYMIEYDPNFDTNPSTSWARQILTAEGVSGSKKMDRLDNYTTFMLRD